MIELREYQNESIELIRGSFKKGNKRVVLCLPTGSGKTVVFSEMVRRAAEIESQTLVLTDRIELFKQTFSALKRIDVNPQTINKDSKLFSPFALVTVGMVETAFRRMDQLRDYNPKLIIIDEAHKGNFNKIIDLFPDSRVIGATATPVGKHFSKYYQDIVANIDIPELIQQGFLSPCKAFQAQDDFSDLKMAGSDYSDESLLRHFDKPKLYAGAIEEYMRRTPGQKAVCFCVNVEHTMNTYAAFKAAGLPAYFVHSKMAERERPYMIKSFERDPQGIMINCGVLTTGYDHAPIQVIIVNRKTASLPLWLQMCGRGGRIYRDKQFFTVLDFGMNHNVHGLWQEERAWSIAPMRRRKPKEQPAPVKKCDKCEAIIPMQAKRCSHCGYEFPVEDEIFHNGVLVEVKPRVPSNVVGKRIKELTVSELAELQKSKSYKSGFVWRVVRSQGEDAIKEYAKLMGYSTGWIQREIVKMDNKEFAFTNHILK